MNKIPMKLEPYTSGTEMLLAWNTGEEFAIPYFELRFHCPCASCVDEHTGKRTLTRDQVKPDVRPLNAVPVGRYAIQFSWSDRHQTGMYPFDSLYALCLQSGKKLN